MHPEKRQFVPIAALEHDQAISDVEETASVQEGRACWQLSIPAAPLPDCPLSVLEQIEHLGRLVREGAEEVLEALPDGRLPMEGRFGDLVVDGVIGVAGA